MPNRNTLGGIIHTDQKYDPVNLPAPTQTPPVLASPAFEHMLKFADTRQQTDELAAKYKFTGRRPLTIPEAMTVKEELENIDALLKQIKEARKNAQIAIIDMELPEQFTEPGDMDKLEELQRMVENYVREMA